jgi:hypothetical protein
MSGQESPLVGISMGRGLPSPTPSVLLLTHARMAASATHKHSSLGESLRLCEAALAC